MSFGIWVLGFGVWGLGLGVRGVGFGVWGLGFGVRPFPFVRASDAIRQCLFRIEGLSKDYTPNPKDNTPSPKDNTLSHEDYTPSPHDYTTRPKGNSQESTLTRPICRAFDAIPQCLFRVEGRSKHYTGHYITETGSCSSECCGKWSRYSRSSLLSLQVLEGP